MNRPVRFVFGLHLHQPVGNFDHVFAQHLDDVYAPLLDALEEADFFPVVLHVSGPLLEWLQRHTPAYVARLAAHVRAGRIEAIASGYDEPVLAMLPRADRLHQIRTMREAIRTVLGGEATAAWLTERVWEPDLTSDLAEAGITSVLVDDRHFLVTGFEPEHMHRPWITEHDGRTIRLLPILERLRYLIPFRPPEETVAYLRTLRDQGHELAILADDGEKFGGWPGTRQWVYEERWLARFLATMKLAIDEGVVQLSTLKDAVEEIEASGPAYLHTASYREMEGWSLPPQAATRLRKLEHDLGARAQGAESALVRGSHWKNFLAKYPESNRMHKQMLRVSQLCRDLGDPVEARAAVGRAQCNDAYWHGVFGGLYLPFLRAAIWRNLAEAEGRLRAGDRFHVESSDVDADGQTEFVITSGDLMAVVAPARGGALETFVRFADGLNYADVLTRRFEAYHGDALDASQTTTDHTASATATDGGMPSIHDLEAANRLDAAPPVDLEPRAMFVERIVPVLVDLERWKSGSYPMLATWANAACHAMWRVRDGEAAIAIASERPHLEKLLRFTPDGSIEAEFAWTGTAYPDDCVFTTEISLSAPMRVEILAGTAEIWRYPVETIAKSERGLDRTVQGEAIVVRAPVTVSALTLRLVPVP